MISQFTEPALVLTYAPSGFGKTTDCLYSFPDALYIAQPGALKPYVNIVGLPYMPAQAPRTKTIMQATSLIVQEAKTKKRTYTAVVVDDFSLMCDASFQEIEEKGAKGLQFWGAVRRVLLDFRDAARDAGLHIILNCHERGPHTDEKKGYCRGGPQLPGVMPEDFPKSCDMCLRARKEPWPAWPVIYSAHEGDDDWVEKDRHGFIPLGVKCGPMNLGELMRLGFKEGPTAIRRARGLEWQEKVVEQVAARLRGSSPGSPESKAVLRAFAPLIEAKYTKTVLHIEWVFRDAIARAWLLDKHAESSLKKYTE